MRERTTACTLILLLFGSSAGACNRGGRPSTRVGSLPFPGAYTLFKAVSPTRLGTHSYARPRGDEASRGILYTCHAGFLDLAHVRFTIDWTRYVRDQVHAALRVGSERVVIDGMDDTTYEITLRAPVAWAGLTDAERERARDAAALQVGQRVALLLGTWHEILTYSGYRTTGVLSERRSAFTYDDMSSHIVGLEVAGEALQTPACPFDEAVTRALDARLHELGVVDEKCLHAAIERVRGEWWEGREALVYQTATGLNSEALRPMLVDGLDCCPRASADPLALPPMDAGLAHIVIDSPDARELELSRRLDAGPARARFEEGEVARLVESIRAELDACG